MSLSIIMHVAPSDFTHLVRFSRKVVWMKLASTNRDPAVTFGYFLDSVHDLNGIHLKLYTLYIARMYIHHIRM